MQRSYKLVLESINETLRYLEVSLVVNDYIGAPVYAPFNPDNLFQESINRLHLDVGVIIPATLSEGQTLYMEDGTPVVLAHDYKLDSYRPVGGLYEWTDVFSYASAYIIYAEDGRRTPVNRPSPDYDYYEASTPAGEVLVPELPGSWPGSGWARVAQAIMVQGVSGQYFYVHPQAWGLVAQRSLAELQVYKPWLTESSAERKYFLNEVFGLLAALVEDDTPVQMESWGGCMGVESDGWLDWINGVKAGTGLNFNIAERPIFWYPFLSAGTLAAISAWNVQSSGTINISVWCRSFPDNFWTVPDFEATGVGLGILLPMPEFSPTDKTEGNIKAGSLVLTPFGLRQMRDLN